MRTRLGAAALVAAAVALLGAAGGTYAAFTDHEDAPAVLVEAGTLDLSLDTVEGTSTEPVTVVDLRPEPVPPAGEPWSSEHHYLVRLTNEGSVPGGLEWAATAVAELENGCNAPERDADDPSCGTGSDEGELGGQLRLTFSALPGDDCAVAAASSPSEPFPITAGAAFADVKPAGARYPLVLGPGESRCVRVDVHLPVLPTNNLAQGDASTFRLQFRLDQAL
jgi:predicted ribosomally synthesized peptide with SipW-like signal peptide